jgi:hypothetical protein
MERVMGSGYVLGDVSAARIRIREAIPEAQFEETDYGFGLSVTGPGMKYALVVFQPGRDDIGQPEIIGDVGRIIEALRGE